MGLTGSLAEQIGQHLSEQLSRHVEVEQAFAVGGGSINDAWRIETNAGRFFLKTNRADSFPSMFEAEADGLERIATTNTLHVPRVLGLGEDHDTAWLLLQWIEGGRKEAGDALDAGRKLARMHRNTSPNFGLERNNYIGSLVQQNEPDKDWVDFFITRRITPMLERAIRRGRVGKGLSFRMERIFTGLEGMMPKEPPALLHGDLWQGNFMFDDQGRPWVFDPAVYYGHREADLAMMRLFGGFSEGFLDGYQSEYPLQSGWEERVDLFNLYPLLVHVVLFGGSYVAQVEDVVQRYA